MFVPTDPMEVLDSNIKELSHVLTKLIKIKTNGINPTSVNQSDAIDLASSSLSIAVNQLSESAEDLRLRVTYDFNTDIGDTYEN